MSSPVSRIGFARMTQEDAETIADWRYDPPYDFYDWAADEDDLAELLDPVRRGERYFSARDRGKELIGFFSFTSEGDVVGVGLGLRPDLTGAGLGEPFLEVGLSFAKEHYRPRRFRLSVADFNLRAIKVYERVGFVTVRSFMHHTNGGLFSFVEMERPA